MKMDRRKDYDIESHKFGLDREALIESMLIKRGIKHVWHNKYGESFKDIDFDIWIKEKFAQICSEAIGEDRTDEHHGNGRVRFRTSAIEEQAYKPHPVFYVQPVFDGSFAYWLPISTLYKYLKMSRRDLEWDYGIQIYPLTIKGKTELFMDIPVKRNGKVLVKEMQLC